MSLRNVFSFKGNSGRDSGGGVVPLIPDAWNEGRIESLSETMCEDIKDTLAPRALRRWLRENAKDEEEVAKMFCFCARVKIHITDDSDLGVYSHSSRAKIYRGLAEQMPKLLVIATYCEPAVVRAMELFMEQWEEAEDKIGDEHCDLISAIDPKDIGPFFYWLLNERVLRCADAQRTHLDFVAHTCRLLPPAWHVSLACVA